MRAKFKLNSVTLSIGSKQVVEDGVTKYVPAEMHTLTMNPVYANNDPNHENSKFWAASPGGEFKLNCVNADAVKDLKLGAEYYLDITEAPAG
jgi:hypothetical protein